MRRKVFSNRNLFFPRMLSGGLTWLPVTSATVNGLARRSRVQDHQTLSLTRLFRAHVSVSIGPPPASKSQ